MYNAGKDRERLHPIPAASGVDPRIRSSCRQSALRGEPVAQTLSDIEQRVLGVLIEKSMTQPDIYPLSLNALVLGCNQKQNRHPVTSVSEQEAAQTLTYLMVRGLVLEINPGRGGRVKKYRHEAESHLGWHDRACAVMAELLLRGPQTVGELRTRCSRMVPFDSIDIVNQELDKLASHEPPLVETMPREPGKSAVRYRHRMAETESAPVAQDHADTAFDADAAGADVEPPVEQAEKRADPSGLDHLQEQIDDLRRQVARLTERVDDLER